MLRLLSFVLPLGLDSFAVAAALGALSPSRRERWRIAALASVGGWMLLSGDEDAEEERIRRLSKAHGVAIIGLGISISLDELAIGFSLGLARLSVVEVVVAIAIQAFIAVQLGLWLGSRVGDRLREGIERVAAIALVLLGVFLVVEHLLG